MEDIPKWNRRSKQVKVHLQGKLQDGNISITSSDEAFTFVIDQRPREVIQGELSISKCHWWRNMKLQETSKHHRTSKQKIRKVPVDLSTQLQWQPFSIISADFSRGLELGVQTMTKLVHFGHLGPPVENSPPSYNQISIKMHYIIYIYAHIYIYCVYIYMQYTYIIYIYALYFLAYQWLLHVFTTQVIVTCPFWTPVHSLCAPRKGEVPDSGTIREDYPHQPSIHHNPNRVSSNLQNLFVWWYMVIANTGLSYDIIPQLY